MNESPSSEEENRVEIPKISCISRILSIVAEYWFFLGIYSGISLAYLFPNVGKTGGYIRSEWTVKYGCIILVFFLNGLSVKTKELLKEILHIRLHLLIQFYSLCFIPFTIYFLKIILLKISLNSILVCGFILLGCGSTTISSNVIMTKNAQGNENGALINAILGNVLAVFYSPILILYFAKHSIFNDLLSKEKQINYQTVIRELTLLVLIPFLCGQILHSISTKQIEIIRNKLQFTQIINFTLLIVIWSVFSTSFANQIFDKISRKDLLLLIFIDLGFYLIFFSIILIIARLPISIWQFSKEDSIAITFCGSMKSVAMVISLVNCFFHKENEQIIALILLPAIIYHLQQLILSPFFVIFFKKWISTDQSISKRNNPDDTLMNQTE